MIPIPAHPRASTGCSLSAFGVVEAAPEVLSGLRRRPGPADGPALAAGLLNHAEDQSVAAVAAVLNAIDAGGLKGHRFTDWGVVSATCFQGRVPLAGSLEKYRRLGPLSVSPLIIPFMSLHSTSSMISLALRVHGPCVGVGGGDGEFVQALMTGIALQQEQDLPGVWVVATGWEPEMLPTSQPDGPLPVCRAAALALLPEKAAAAGSGLRLVPAAENNPGVPRFTELVRFLSNAATTGGQWQCPVGGGYRLELRVNDAATRKIPLAKSA